MKKLSTTQRGEIFLFSSALLWSFLPIISLLSFDFISPLFSLAISTLIAAAFFGITLTYNKKWSELKTKHVLKDILLMTLFIGVGFYGLVFVGMKQTSAGDASILLQMEILFSILILGLFKKECLPKSHIVGALLMGLGATMILLKDGPEINQGNLIILFATSLPPLGNYFSQKARKKVSSHSIMFLRSLVGGFFLLGLAFTLEKPPEWNFVSKGILALTINGVLLLGLSKIFWIEAIHRINISKAVALGAICPAFTLIFAYFILSESPTAWQVLGFLPILSGIWLLTDFGKKKAQTTQNLEAVES